MNALRLDGYAILINKVKEVLNALIDHDLRGRCWFQLQDSQRIVLVV
jgi:hypothetical protein